MKKTNPPNILTRGSESPCAERTISSEFTELFQEMQGCLRQTKQLSLLQQPHEPLRGRGHQHILFQESCGASMPVGPREVNVGCCRSGLSTSCLTLRRHCLRDWPSRTWGWQQSCWRFNHVQPARATSLLSLPAPPQTVPAFGVCAGRGDTREHSNGGQAHGWELEKLITQLSLFSLSKSCLRDHKMSRHLKHGNGLGCRGLPRLWQRHDEIQCLEVQVR